MKYQEAGNLFRHVSTLRRTTIAFVFMATGASLALMGPDPLKQSSFHVMLCAVNVLLVLGALLQDFHLERYQKDVGPFLRSEEGGSGPYTATHQAGTRRLKTGFVVRAIDFVLLCGWSVLLLFSLGVLP